MHPVQEPDRCPVAPVRCHSPWLGVTVMRPGSLLRAFAFVSLWLTPFLSPAAIQFDVFLGHDSIIPTTGWFPATFEIRNDGPSFSGFIEFGPDMGESQIRRLPIELPTGTLKRVTIPAFASRRTYSWHARLIDDRRRVRAEQPMLRQRRSIINESILMGAFPRTASGLPSFAPIIQGSPEERRPAVARLLPSIFPDNPIVLEALDCIYINSEQIAGFNDAQARALIAWVYAGGQLILAVEQASDFHSASWLKPFLPCHPTAMRTVSTHPEIHAWMSQVAHTQTGPQPQPYGVQQVHPAFEEAPLQVAEATVTDGEVVLHVDFLPFLVSAPRGFGKITVLLTSPEREPFRSWKNLPGFWSKLAGVPVEFYRQVEHQQGGWSADGVFGALIDSRQLNKLPIAWLFVLLIVYLLVIGPLDRHWLRRLGKPMLTWMTFPTYVVCFSLVIWFIGHRLRSGETECNELSVIDVLSTNRVPGIKGRTYVSIYSPQREEYLFKSQHPYAAFRGEVSGSWGGGEAAASSTFMHEGESVSASVSIPVWSSQLYVSDWWQPGEPPIVCQIVGPPGYEQLVIQNRTPVKLTRSMFAWNEQLYTVGDIPAQSTHTVKLDRGRSSVDGAVKNYSSGFYQAVTSRTRAFGSAQTAWLNDIPNGIIGASFLSYASASQPHLRFESTPGTQLETKGSNPVLFAFALDYSPTQPLAQFSPKRTKRSTCWRVIATTAPIQAN